MAQERPTRHGTPPGWDAADGPARTARTRFADVRWLASVDSTNRWALDEARAGAPEGLVTVAGVQVAGRGRRGRTWSARPGAALLASVLLRPEGDPDAAHRSATAVALAAADAVEAVSGVRPGLKWPNDLVVASGPRADRKLAGVLGESVVRGGTLQAVVVGIGCNVLPGALPAEVEATAAAVGDLLGDVGRGLDGGGAGGPGVDPTRLLVELLVALEQRLGQSPAELLEAHRTDCVTLGRDVRVETPQGSIEGRAEALLDDGRLRIGVAGASVDVSVGDVVHLRPLRDGSA